MIERTPVFIQAGYAFRDGYRTPAGMDPDAAGAEIAKAGAGRPGVDLRALVEQARDPKSALHAALTLDPDLMADKLHLIEVREVAGALHYRLVDPRSEEEQVGPRAFTPTDEPNVWRRVEIAYTPLPERPAQGPTQITYTPAPSVRVAEMIAPPTQSMPQSTLPTRHERVVLTDRQYRMREQLQRFAATLADDPYFVAVVKAINELP